MADTDARTPGVPIKPPDAAYTLEALLGRADEPRLKLAGPGEYNDLLQAAGRNWSAVDKSVRGATETPDEGKEVEQRLRELARDRYFLTLTESNVETLLALLGILTRGNLSGSVGSNGSSSVGRILGAWLRRVSVQAAPPWVAKQLPAIVDAACAALVSTAQNGAAGSFVYLLGTAAAAPQCSPGAQTLCRDAATRALQQKTSALTSTAHFPDALVGTAYLIAGGPGLHADHLTTALASLLRLWSPAEGSLSSSHPLSLLQPSNSIPNQDGSSPEVRTDAPVRERSDAETFNPPLPQALALSRLLEYLGASLRGRAFSQDFGTRALALADAKTVQNSIGRTLSDAGRWPGDPTQSAAMLAVAGFYRGLVGRRGDGFRNAAADWARLVEQQEGLLSAAASAVVAEVRNFPQREDGGGYVHRHSAHWVQCAALAAARCDAAPGAPLTGDPALLTCICFALFGGLLSLNRFHHAAAACSIFELRAESSEHSGVLHELTRVVAELGRRANGDAFKNVGVLARSLCDHYKAGDVSTRRWILPEVECFAVLLEGGQRVAAEGLEVLGGEEAPAADGAARKILDAAFLTVTVCCEALLSKEPGPRSALPADSVPSSAPTEAERFVGSIVLKALSCVDFCRVPFARYGQLVTRAVALASGSRAGAETLAKLMPHYEDTIHLARHPVVASLAERLRQSEAVDSAAGHSGGGNGLPAPDGNSTSLSTYREGKTVEGAASTSGRGQPDTNQAFAGGPKKPLQGPPQEEQDSTLWARDKVRASRVHFMLRVLGPCVEKIGDEVFASAVLPTLLLFLLHPSAPVSWSAHALFVAFLETREQFHRASESERDGRPEWGTGTDHDRSANFANRSSGEGSEGNKPGGSLEEIVWDEPVTKPGSKLGFWQRLGVASYSQTASRIGTPPEPSVPERAALFYVERALAGFPGLTSFDALTAGVAAIVRNVPPGSPAIVLTLRRIAAAAKDLFERGVPYEASEGEGKDEKVEGPAESSAGGQLTRLLVHLIPVVDIQVLTGLLQETEAVVLSVADQTAQQAALAELYAVLAANEDYTRKAHCTVWYQHLAEKCVKQFRARVKEGRASAAAKRATVKPRDGAGGRSWPRTWGLSRGRRIPAGEAVT